jgi:hypothetical protein
MVAPLEDSVVANCKRGASAPAPFAGSEIQQLARDGHARTWVN